MDLKESATEKKKARRDYSLAWEARPGDARNVGETKWRVQVQVAGDRAVSITQMWKPPESFERERDRENAVSIGVLVARIVVTSGLVVFGLWLLIDGIRAGKVKWRLSLRMALPAILLAPIGTLLTMHLMARQYETAKPLATFTAMTWMELAMSVITGSLMAISAAAVVTTIVPELGTLGRQNRRAMGRDALVALAAAIGLGLIVYQIQGVMLRLFPAQALPDISVPEWIASRAPALSAISAGTWSWLMNAAVLALAAALVLEAKNWRLPAAGVLLAAAAMLPRDVRTPAEFAVHYVAALAALAAVAVFCVWFGRGNWLAYGMVLWVSALRGPLAQLFGNGNASLEAQGWIVAVVLGVGLLWGAGMTYIEGRA